jgi:L-lysine exporter family protein LysE/ArgO
MAILAPFLNGLFLGMSLIIAIGAQNAFVLRQGILNKHVFLVSLFCSLADSFLICIGVLGISFFFDNFIEEYLDLLFGFSSIWLLSYGLIRLKASFQSKTILAIKITEPKDLKTTLLILMVLTFANPHVYLDTMVLIGSVSQQFHGHQKITFTLGACFASFIFFFTLSYSAKLLSKFTKKVIFWRALDLSIALIMFSIALNLAEEGNWL